MRLEGASISAAADSLDPVHPAGSGQEAWDDDMRVEGAELPALFLKALKKCSDDASREKAYT